MKQLLILVFLFNLFQTFSQTKEVIVIDSVTSNPIPFVTIHFLNSYDGTFTDENGIFKLPLDSCDSLQLNHLTYCEKILKLKDINDTITLSPDAVILKEVVLKNGSKITKYIDFPRKKRSFGSFPMFDKSEILTLIKPSTSIENLSIKEIGFMFEKRTTDKYERNLRTAIRINIYSSMKGKIGKKLFESSVFTINTSEKENLNILLNNTIELDKRGIFIGIENLGDVNTEGSFTNEHSISRPVLTENKIKDYEAETFLRYYFGKNNKLIPLNDVFKNNVNDKIKRNLSISFLISE